MIPGGRESTTPSRTLINSRGWVMFQISRKFKAFHQARRDADEDKLANQSEVAPCCTPALKPLCFLDNFAQNWLDKKCARKYLNPHVIYSEYFLWNVSLILIFPSSSWETFHTIHQTQHPISRIHQRHARSAWLRKTVKLTVIPSNSPDVVFTDSWACEYWPSERVLSSTERRHGTSQLMLLIDETFNMTRHRVTAPLLILTNLFMSSSHYHYPTPCHACDATREVFHSGQIPLAICRVREIGETEAKCFASFRLQMPKSCDWRFPVVVPRGGIIQRCVACWAPASSSI